MLEDEGEDFVRQLDSRTGYSIMFLQVGDHSLGRIATVDNWTAASRLSLLVTDVVIEEVVLGDLADGLDEGLGQGGGQEVHGAVLDVPEHGARMVCETVGGSRGALIFFRCAGVSEDMGCWIGLREKKGCEEIRGREEERKESCG